MPGYSDDPRDGRRAPGNPLADLLGLLPPEARRAVRGLAEDATQAVLRAGGGGPNPLAAAAALAARTLAEAARPRPEGAEPPRPAAERPLAGSPAPAGIPLAIPAAAPPPAAFARLPQPGTAWWQYVRPEAVVAIASPAPEGCVALLANGRELELGGPAEAAAREVPGLVRLTQPGTQRCLYVRPAAVLAVTAPAQGCVLHLADGRTLEAGEAAAVAAGLLAPTT